MGRLYISLLGSLEVTLDEAPVAGLGSDRVKALLAYLATESGRPHTRQALAALLWPEATEASARSSLRSALSRLRKAIRDADSDPPFLLVTRDSVQFNPASDHWLDIEAWGVSTLPEEMETALDLSRGEFLEGLAIPRAEPFEEWLSSARERWRRALSAMLHELAEAHGAQGNQQRALALARRLVEEVEPWDEEGQRLLMRLLAESGQRSAALAQYETCKDILWQELGVNPAPETTALFEAIRSASVGPRRPRGQDLPVPLFPLLGRESELAEVVSLLGQGRSRLLTLVGPGGCGKTHLALEVAAYLAPGLADGVCFVSAAPLRSDQKLVYAVAAALGFAFEGVREAQQTREQLLGYLRGKQMLLVLDNLEHLPEAGELAQDMVQEAPELIVLATSRARLRVPGEQSLVLGGLPYPPTEFEEDIGASESVQLFLEGARRVHASFSPTERDLAHIAGICRLLEGMPLAILMAASWASTLSLAQIEGEIASGGKAGLDFLSTQWRGLPERQRSMRAVLDYSWRLLDEREWPALAALSIFQGGFDSAAAQAVAGATLFDLRNWVERSLLHRLGDERLGMHELMRQYGAGRLASESAEELRQRHASYYMAMLRTWETRLKSAAQVQALDEMSTELDNILAAWSWAVSKRRADLLDQGAHALGLFFLWRCRLQEGMAAFALALDALRKCAPHLVPRFLAWHGKLANAASFRAGLDDLRRAWRLATNGAKISVRDRAFIGSTLAYDLLYYEEKRAVEIFEQAILLWEETGDRWGLAQACVGLAEANRYLSRMKEGEVYGRRAMALFQELGDPRGQAEALIRLFRFAESGQRRAEAIRYLEASMAISGQCGDESAVSGARVLMGDVFLREGRYSEARAVVQQSIATLDDLGYGRSLNVAWRVLWTALNHLGLYRQAQRPGGPRNADEVERNKPFAWGAGLLHGMRELGLENAAEAEDWLRFALENLPPVIDIVQFGLAAYFVRSLFLQGKLAEGRPLMRDALQRALEIGHPDIQAENLLSAALLLAKEGKIEEALECSVVAKCHPVVGNSRLHYDTALRHIEAAADRLSPELAEAARQRGARRDLREAVQWMLRELHDGEPKPDRGDSV